MRRRARGIERRRYGASKIGAHALVNFDQ